MHTFAGGPSKLDMQLGQLSGIRSCTGCYKYGIDPTNLCQTMKAEGCAEARLICPELSIE
jgi:hypothetical protein